MIVPAGETGAAAALRHVTLVASDLVASMAFYDAALGVLGLSRLLEFGDEEEEDSDELEALGYGTPEGPAVLWLVGGEDATRSAHLAFAVPRRADVDAFFDAALAHGGSTRQAPRRWEIYRPGYYGAIVADPDGNLIEALTDE